MRRLAGFRSSFANSMRQSVMGNTPEPPKTGRQKRKQKQDAKKATMECKHTSSSYQDADVSLNNKWFSTAIWCRKLP